MFERQGDPPCLGCYVYFACVGHGKGAWDATGRLLRNIDFAENFLPSVPPPLLPLFMARQTHPQRLPPKPSPSSYRDCRRVRVSKTRCLPCSRWLPYEHQRHSPIAHFGGRLRVNTCEAHDAPGVHPGVVGAYRPRARSWGVCSCARAGTLLRAPPAHGMGA